jgi:hypothetical protein
MEDIFRHLTLPGGQAAYEEVKGLESPWAGIQGLGDVKSKYGLTGDVGPMFDALRRRLAGQRGRALGSSAIRQGAGTAIPEAGFGQLEGQFGDAFANLGAQEVGAQLGEEKWLAQFFNALQGQNFDWQQKRPQIAGQMLGNLTGQSQDFFKQEHEIKQSSPTALSWLSTVLGPAVDIGLAIASGGATLPFSLAKGALGAAAGGARGGGKGGGFDWKSAYGRGIMNAPTRGYLGGGN